MVTINKKKFNRKVSQESYYTEQEDSTATHNNKIYSLNKLFRLTHTRKIINIDVSKLIWVLPYTQINPQRLLAADVTKPILVYNDKKYGLTAIDGAHRLSKAVDMGLKQLPAIMLTDFDMKQAEIK